MPRGSEHSDATQSDALRWSSWPARERPFAAVGGGLAVVAFGVAGAVFAGHWLVGAATCALLVAFLQRFWFPVRCAIDAHEAQVRTLLDLRRIELAMVRRVAREGSLLLLSTRSAPSRSDTIRGLVLPLPTDPALAARVLHRIESIRPPSEEAACRA